MLKGLASICLALGLSTVPAAAAGSSTGEVTRLYVHNGDSAGGMIMFAAGTHNNKPSCSTLGDEWAFELGTPEGQAMYALLLSAVPQGLSIHVVGTGTCDAWGDRETARYIRVDF